MQHKTDIISEMRKEVRQNLLASRGDRFGRLNMLSALWLINRLASAQQIAKRARDAVSHCMRGRERTK